MTEITLYLSDQRGKAHVVIYPYRFTVRSVEDMEQAMAYDHVCAEYRNNHRSIENFILSDCLPVDLDNSHSDDPSEWKSLEDVQAAFPGVELWAVESRSHMKPKDGKAPRPKYHIYFPIHPVADAAAYADLKRRAIARFPWFDTMAKDAARFFYGVESPHVCHFPGGGGGC